MLFYITDYITKTQLKSHVSFSALEAALKRLGNPDPTDTDIELRAKKMLQKCVYSIISHQELSGQQVAAYLKGYGDHYSSHKYQNLYWTAFEKSINADDPSPECYCLHENSIQGQGCPLSSPEPGPELDHPDVDGELDGVRLIIKDAESDNDTKEDEDVMITATQEGNIIQCSTQVHDYHFCSSALSHLSVWDFISQVDKVNKPDAAHNVNSNEDMSGHLESSDEDDNEPTYEVENSLQDEQRS